MEPVGIFVFLSCLLILIEATPAPGSSHHHVHHRIHVPQKIKTIYHTKVIKVPEHHYHEKEVVVTVPVEKEKLVFVPEKHEHEPVYPPLKDFSSYGEHEQLYDGSEHNILKKHAPNHQMPQKKQRKLRKS